MINFPNNPALGDAFSQGGTVYTCVLANPVVWNAAPGAAAIPEAPLDGKTYGRNTAAWKALDKTDVGLDKVDNTSDATKPVSGPTQAALNGKQAVIPLGGAFQWWRGDQTWQSEIVAAGVFALTDKSFGMVANASYPNIVFTADQRRIECARSSGDFYIVGISNNILHNFGATGVFTTQAIQSNGVIDANGRITGHANGDVAALYAPAGGIYSDWNSPQAIRANVGGISANTTIQCGGTATIGGNLTAAAGMTMYYDGSQGNYLGMGSGYGAVWAWEWNRSSGNLRWVNNASATLLNVGTGGRITANDGYDSSDYYGVRCLGSTGDGSSYGYCAGVQGTPTQWNLVHYRPWHQFGAWAGIQFYADGAGNAVQMVLSNAGGWGSLRAASFEVQSDATTKEEILPVESALAVIEGIKAYTYKFIDNETVQAVDNSDGKRLVEVQVDKATKYNVERRHAGSMSQDWQSRLPEAVSDSGGGNLMLDYAAIGAVTAQAVSELLQRVKALEAKLGS